MDTDRQCFFALLPFSKALWLHRLLAVLGIYVLICLIIAARQRKLLYFPQKLSHSVADDAFAFFRLHRWPDASSHDYRALIHDADKIDALVMATPWDTLANVAAQHYPWLPVRLLLRDRFDSVHNLSQYKGEVTIVLAEADEIIPRKSTMALYESLSSIKNKRLLNIPEAGHNDWFYFVTDAQWREILPE